MKQKEVEMKVHGMHCMGCVNKIKKSIQDQFVNTEVNVELQSGTVNVKYPDSPSDAPVTVSQLKGTIQDLGFDVMDVQLKSTEV